MNTPHNSAQKGDFAKTVLMPGDPLRSQFIAENFLENAKLVNNVRGVQGYTGTYKGTPVSVMASGMGIPSIAIYSHELFHEYDVDNIIRVGSAGGINEKLHLRDVLIAQGASTNSNYPKHFDMPGQFSPMADFHLLETAVAVARERGVEPMVGSVFSTDVFYNPLERDMKWAEMGILAVEMETAALYSNAAAAGKRALTLCTISDDLVRQEFLPPEERQLSFKEMIGIALETAVKLAEEA